MQSIKKTICLFGFVLALSVSTECLAQRPVVGPFANAAQYESLPITARPNRIGHVYGNTVRRRYDRQQQFLYVNMRTQMRAPVFTPVFRGRR